MLVHVHSPAVIAFLIKLVIAKRIAGILLFWVPLANRCLVSCVGVIVDTE